jgi:protoporphyrinogen oxidase
MMGYFEGGTEVLLTRLRDRIEGYGGRVRLRAPVEAVPAEGGRARGVRVDGADLEYDAVISTVPLPLLASLLPPEQEAQRERLSRVNYLGVACVAARLERSLCDSFWCNIHDHRVPFNGVIETSKLNPELGRGGPLAYCPNYLPLDHPRFSYTDEQLFEEFAAALPLLRPGLDAGAVRDFRVFRSRYAQAVCPTGFRHLVPGHRTDLAGLFMTDSTQLYPEDRTVSGTIVQAREASRLALEFAGGGMIRSGMEAG